jgi:thiol:disulfide interchange protein DsbD
MIPITLIPALAAVLSAGGAIDAQPAKATHARPRLVAETTTLVPGTIAWLGFAFDIDEHWHIYWDGKGDTGQPVKATFTLPPGFEAGEIVWPAPKRFVVADFVLDYIYEHKVLLLVPLKIPSNAKTGDSISLSAKLDWMECAEECRPGHATVQLTLPIGASGETPTKSADAPRFDESRKRIPRPVEEAAKAVKTEWTADTVTLSVSDARGLSFYPHRTSITLSNPLEQGASKESRLRMDLVPGSGERVVGILEVYRAPAKPGDPPTSEVYHVDLARTGMRIPPPTPAVPATTVPPSPPR